MVELAVRDGKLMLEVRGWDKIWALKSRLAVKIGHITDVAIDPTVARGWWKGLRLPGTHLPGVIIAGTFYQGGERIFWDVHDPAKAIVIELRDERYSRLVVEVDDPEAALHLIRSAAGNAMAAV